MWLASVSIAVSVNQKPPIDVLQMALGACRDKPNRIDLYFFPIDFVGELARLCDTEVRKFHDPPLLFRCFRRVSFITWGGFRRRFVYREPSRENEHFDPWCSIVSPFLILHRRLAQAGEIGTEFVAELLTQK